MTEEEFRPLANAVIERVRGAVDAHDPDVVEGVMEAGVLKIVFGASAGPPFVLNMQPPLRELWLAADRRAWHFKFDGARWLEKKNGDELFATLTALVRARAGVGLALP
jgi:CyaY protein